MHTTTDTLKLCIGASKVILQREKMKTTGKHVDSHLAHASLTTFLCTPAFAALSPQNFKTMQTADNWVTAQGLVHVRRLSDTGCNCDIWVVSTHN